MPPGRFLLSTLLSMLPIIAAADDDLASRFAAFLKADDATAVRELAAASVDTTTAWRTAIDVINRYDCISIGSVAGEVMRADADERLVRVTIRGEGLSYGEVRTIDPLPPVWILRAVPSANGWRVAEARTREDQVALEILQTQSDDKRRALLDPGLDLARVATLLAVSSLDRRDDHGLAMTRFAHDLSIALGDVNGAEYARQMESKLNTLLGRGDDATRIALQSLENCLGVCDADTLAGAHYTAAFAYWGRDDLVTAVDYFRRAAAEVDRMRDPIQAIKAWVNIGHLEHSRGRLSRALAAADATERLARAYGWTQGELDALMMQDAMHSHLGNVAVAAESARKAYELAVKLQGHQRLVIATINYAGLLSDTGRADEAIRYLRTVTPIDRANDIMVQIYLGRVLMDHGQRAEAMEIFERIGREGTAAGQPAYAAAAKMHLSYLVRGDDPARALELAREAIALRSNISTGASRTDSVDWELRTAEGLALRALGRHAEAETAFEAALAGVEAERDAAEIAPATHANYPGWRVGVYHNLIDLRLMSSRVEDAVRLSERLKGAMLEGIRDADSADITSLLTGDERAEQQAIEANIARLNSELFRARLDARRAETLKAELQQTRVRWEALETALHARHDVRRARNTADPLASPDVLLPTAADAILDYVVSAQKVTLFVVTRGEDAPLKIDVHTIEVGEVELKRDIDRFLDRLGAGSFAYEEDAQRLHRLLLAPAEKALRDKKTVVVIGDGPLWRLPFQALQGSDGKPLVTRFAMVYAPSLASLLRVPAPPSRERPAVLAIGNPRFSDAAAARVATRTGTALGDLPDAAIEAKQVAALYDPARSRLLTSRQATEGAVKEQAAEFDVLHIAAHAVTDDNQPLYSGILLARDAAGEDGLLEGREITRLGLNARLAVLSACSTAQGQVRPGEGLIGLSWAFLVAGCPTIVASQWRVPSASTARLMVDFHREFARGDTSVAEALRAAQLRLMKDSRYRHPFYWSAFVVVGAGR